MRALIEQNLDGYAGSGDVYVIRHLTSETGRTLNGKKCRIMGHNGKRLEVQLLDDPNASREGYRLLPRNLLPVRQAFVPPPGPPLDDGVLVRELRAAMAHTAVRDLVGPDSERQDAQARVDYARRYVDQGQVPPPSKCVDPMCPTPPHSMLAVMAEFAPCCSGDQVVDFHRFASGTVGTGQECAVCMEAVTGHTPALGMPCGHVFHRACAGEWLANNDTCPTCRFELGGPGVEYAEMLADRDERVRIRLREWFISGMCDRCQATYQEADPLAVIKDMATGAALLVPRSQLGRG